MRNYEPRNSELVLWGAAEFINFAILHEHHLCPDVMKKVDGVVYQSPLTLRLAKACGSSFADDPINVKVSPPNWSEIFHAGIARVEEL